MSRDSDKQILWTFGSLAVAVAVGILVRVLSPQESPLSPQDSAKELEYLRAIIGLLSLGIGVLTTIVIIVIKNFHAGYDDRRTHTEYISGKIDVLLGKIDVENKIMREDLRDSYYLVIRSIANTRGVVNIGDISTAFRRLDLLMKKSIRVIDTIYRPELIDFYQYHNGLRSWGVSIRDRIKLDAFECYEIIMCDNTLSYYDELIVNGVMPDSNLVKKIHSRKIRDQITVPYPNILIFYGEDRVNSLVLGWPFIGHGALGDIFLIEDQGLVAYFEKICVATIYASDTWHPQNNANSVSSAIASTSISREVVKDNVEEDSAASQT